jgi:hypothetical protein
MLLHQILFIAESSSEKTVLIILFLDKGTAKDREAYSFPRKSEFRHLPARLTKQLAFRPEYVRRDLSSFET